MKTCTLCQSTKPLTDFYFEKRLNRHMTRCKDCYKQKVKAWRDTPSGAASVKEAYQRKKASGYRNAPYASKTPEQRAQMAAAVKAWRDKHRKSFNDEQRQSLQLRRSLAARVAWPVIVAHYGSRCLCCGADRTLCMDHVIPLSANGPNLLTNLQPLCRACNTFKGSCPVPDKDYRPDSGAWIAELARLNPWLVEPLPPGRWHRKAGGPQRLARLNECAASPLAMPSM